VDPRFDRAAARESDVNRHDRRRSKVAGHLSASPNDRFEDLAMSDSAVWWGTRFARCVRKYGISKLAEELGVEDAAIYQWISGRTIPRPDRATKIVALVRGLTLEHIYEHRLIVNAIAPAPADQSSSEIARQ
jgi:DNA-binding transcriptional regulator YdaS (Cro superfamily)